jgi:hypothetical protein
MKIKIPILLLLFINMMLSAESNVTEVLPIKSEVTEVELTVISKLSEFFGAAITGYNGHIEHLLMIFGFMVTFFIAMISLFGYFKIRGISVEIEKNRELIADYTAGIDKKFSDYRKEMKQEIIEEVKQQIVYGLDDAVLKVQEHAYKKVEYTVSSLTDEIQKRRFHYQSLIFKVNQVKKYEYEEIMKQDIELEDKISKILIIQSKYNEINNSDIPKLFSKHIEEKVVPTARKLSEYKELRHIVIKLLLKALENDKLNYVEITQIKDILKECYDWEEKEDNK